MKFKVQSSKRSSPLGGDRHRWPFEQHIGDGDIALDGEAVEVANRVFGIEVNAVEEVNAASGKFGVE